MTDSPSQSSKQMLGILNMLGYRMYEGTVPAKVKARRRAKNRVAKQSRKVNRGS